jgi:hypothetical protein
MLFFVAILVSDTKWLVAHPNCIQNESLQTERCVTKFRRVRVVELINAAFLQCSCGYFARMGLPCKHILRITNTVSATMCHIRWAKQYLFQFGKNDYVTDLLLTMQKVGQNNMVPLPSSLNLPSSTHYPSFLYDTTKEAAETMLLLHRHVRPVPTCYHLAKELAVVVDESEQDDAITNGFGVQEETVLSPARRHMRCTSPDDNDDMADYEITFDGTMKICKTLFNVYKNQPNGIATLQQKLYSLYSEVCAEITSRRPISPSTHIASSTVVCSKRKTARLKSAGL